MTYNNWKLMDEISVAVKTSPEENSFTGFVFETGDKDAEEKAKDWARERQYNFKTRKYTKTYEPKVYNFENKDFTVTILNSAGGSSQGGRLSFWRCRLEKDGVSFTIGVNDAVLADLIASSTIFSGIVSQKVMFARKSGQPGLIHEGMQSYKDAVADMEHKATMKSAKKTSKWEIGGVYSTITQSDVCLGEVWDTWEKYYETTGWSNYQHEKYRTAETPKKVMLWVDMGYRLKDQNPQSVNDVFKYELASTYHYVYSGKPPARAKTEQLDATNIDYKLLDKLLELTEKGRYKRELK